MDQKLRPQFGLLLNILICLVMLQVACSKPAHGQNVTATVASAGLWEDPTRGENWLGATIRLEDVVLDENQLERNRITFTISGYQNDMILSIGIHEGDTVSELPLSTRNVSVSPSGRRTAYFSAFDEQAFETLQRSLSDYDQKVIYSICRFISDRRNYNLITQQLLQSVGYNPFGTYVKVQSFFRQSTRVDNLLEFSRLCADNLQPIDASELPGSNESSANASLSSDMDANLDILHEVPSLAALISEIERLIAETVSFEDYNQVVQDLRDSEQRLSLLEQTTVSQRQYDSISRQLEAAYSQIAELRRSTVANDEHARVQQLLTEAQDEIRRLTEETVPASEVMAYQRRIEQLETQLADAISSQPDDEPQREQSNVEDLQPTNRENNAVEDFAPNTRPSTSPATTSEPTNSPDSNSARVVLPQGCTNTHISMIRQAVPEINRLMGSSLTNDGFGRAVAWCSTSYGVSALKLYGDGPYDFTLTTMGRYITVMPEGIGSVNALCIDKAGRYTRVEPVLNIATFQCD